MKTPKDLLLLFVLLFAVAVAMHNLRAYIFAVPYEVVAVVIGVICLKKELGL